MKRMQLLVETREKSGKEVNKKLRKNGYVPGIFYSPHDRSNILLKIPEKELFRFLSDKKRAHGIIDLKIKTDGKKETTRLAVIKDFQYNSLQRKINHFDFYGVSMEEKVTLDVPLILEGEPEGVNEGGILDISLREVTVECFPADAPQSLTVDISKMGFNDVITLEDVVVPEDVKLLTDISRTVASVIAPSKIEEEVAEEEELTEEEVAEEELTEEEVADTEEKIQE